MGKVRQFASSVYAKLPATAPGARSLRTPFYYTGKPCKRGHMVPCYTSSGQCVACFDHRSDEIKKCFAEDRAPDNIVRAVVALKKGQTTYTPDRPCKHGHRLRFVGSNNCVECSRRACKTRGRDYGRWRRMRAEYGIDKQDFCRMLEEQRHACAICAGDIADSPSTHVDHDHTTGRVRGLLCSRCNQAIGLLREDEKLFRRAVNYLRRHAAT